MPTFEITAPDGRKFRVNGPEGATQEQALAQVQSQYGAPKAEAPREDKYIAPHNVVMGALKGASDIGTTLLRPVDAVLNATGISDRTNADRKASMQQFFKENADPESLYFKGGDLAAGIAGTAGIGGVLGKAAGVAGASPKVIAALESGGFRLAPRGAQATGGVLANTALRGGAGAAGGAAAAGLINPEDAGTGAVIGGVAAPAVAVAGRVGNALGSGLRLGGNKLMQSALKPTVEQLKSGDADIAIKTLLESGISPTMGGVRKMQAEVFNINDKIAELIKDSGAKIDKQKIVDTLSDVRAKFANQVTPQDDLIAIQSVADKFLSHPKLTNLDAIENAYKEAISRAEKAKISALQDAGRFETMAAQQRNLGRGRAVDLSPQQTANTPYFNVGATGGEARSMRDIAGYARPAERYAPNTPRIAEAQSAAQDARRIAGERAIEAQNAQRALAEHIASGGSGIPVQLAQDMKKGTYRVIAGKYGEMGSASTEAQKALARGLKEGIAEAVPQVAGLNARESALLKTLDVTERRALMDANKNPFGLSLLAGNPQAWAAFMADRSSAFKGLAARLANRAGEIAPAPTRRLNALLENPVVRNALIQYESR